MSTLRIDNFAPSAGGTSFGIEGIAKATASYNQNAGTVLSSENVSSITDNSTGNFTVNFGNNWANAVFVLGSTTGRDARVTVLGYETSSGGKTTADADLINREGANTGSQDAWMADMQWTGDLA